MLLLYKFDADRYDPFIHKHLRKSQKSLLHQILEDCNDRKYYYPWGRYVEWNIRAADQNFPCIYCPEDELCLKYIQKFPWK